MFLYGMSLAETKRTLDQSRGRVKGPFHNLAVLGSYPKFT